MEATTNCTVYGQMKTELAGSRDSCLGHLEENCHSRSQSIMMKDG